MMWLKMGKHSFGTAIDLCDLGLDEIEETENEFRIGAMVTLRQMEKHPGLAAYSCGAVEAAFKDIVGVQFRNGATLGGSLSLTSLHFLWLWTATSSFLRAA